jgi:hypothetical protein
LRSLLAASYALLTGEGNLRGCVCRSRQPQLGVLCLPAVGEGMYAEQLGFGVVWRAVLFPFVYLFTVARLAFLPFALAALATFIVYRLSWPEGIDFTDVGNLQNTLRADWPSVLIIYVINAVMVSVYSIRIHRKIIGAHASSFVSVLLSRALLAYIGAIFIFSLFLALAKVIFHRGFLLLWEMTSFAVEAFKTGGETNAPSLTWVGSAIAAIVLLVLAVQIGIRLLPIMPHAAVSGRIGLIASWRAMNGNVWLSFEALVIFWIVTAVMISVLVFRAMAASTYVSEVASIYIDYQQFGFNQAQLKSGVLIGLLLITYIMLVTMNAALLSFIYRSLDMNWGEARLEPGRA